MRGSSNYSGGWSGVCTINATVSSSGIWTQWNSAYYIQSSGASGYVGGIGGIVTATAQRIGEYLDYLGREARVREIADERAVKILTAHLTPEQREQYRREKCFEVLTTREGKIRRYRISHGWAGNITVLNGEGQQIEKLCIHPAKRIPFADNLLAQKLLLEADEDQFLKIANHTPLPALERVIGRAA